MHRRSSRAPTALFVLASLGLAASAGAQAPRCPDFEALLDPMGYATAGNLDALKVELQALDPEACAPAFFEAAWGLNFPDLHAVLPDLAPSWKGPVALDAAYTAFGRAMLQPQGRAEDAAFHTARFIRLASPPGDDLLAPVAAGTRGTTWLSLARARFISMWGTDEAPPADEAFDARATEHLRACLAEPSTAPADPFDPHGRLQRDMDRLGVGPRCASAAVLAAWTGEPGAWQDQVQRLVAAYSPQAGLLGSLPLELEARWGQGEAGEGSTTLEPPAVPTPLSPSRILQLGAAAWLLLGLALASRGGRARDAALRLLAILIGAGGLLLVEFALRLLGVPPGDEARPRPPLEPSLSKADADGVWIRDQRGSFAHVPPPANTVRIAVVGASSVAGPNLAQAESIPSQFGQRLREQLPCLEVVNLGHHGFASPQFRDLAMRAVDDWQADGVVVYGGHNEVADSRAQDQFLGSTGSSGPWRDLLVRTSAWGLLQPILAPSATEAVVVAQTAAPAARPDLSVYTPAFEHAVTSRFAREFEDLARAMDRRDAPLIFAMPSFNHHGLRVGTSDDSPEFQGMLDSATEALRAGDAAAALARADKLRAADPLQPAAWMLTSLARELGGDLVGAEAAIWETARLNQLGSAITPGVASRLREIAGRLDVPLADAHAALHAASGEHLPGFDLFFDYVHVNPRGAELVGRTLAETAVAAGWVERFGARCEGAQ